MPTQRPVPARLLPVVALAASLAASLAACSAQAPTAAEATAAGTAPAAVAAVDVHPDVHRFAIGSAQAAMLRDGRIELPNDGSIVAQGEAKAEVDALLRAAGLPAGSLELSVQALLVRHGDRVLLFDTGAGNASFVDGGRLPAALRAAGMAPEAVTDIFISHAHGDHVGGLLDAQGGPAFVNATVHLSQPEWAALQANPSQQALAAAIAPRVKAFAPDASDLVPGVSAVAVDGHTPGHSAYEIVSGPARLLYLGDTAHHHVISVQRPRWTIQFDGDAPLAEDSREALLARAADAGLDIASPHFPYPGLGRIERRDGGLVWVPGG